MQAALGESPHRQTRPTLGALTHHTFEDPCITVLAAGHSVLLHSPRRFPCAHAEPAATRPEDIHATGRLFRALPLFGTLAWWSPIVSHLRLTFAPRHLNSIDAQLLVAEHSRCPGHICGCRSSFPTPGPRA
jgi:hypothetical protein